MSMEGEKMDWQQGMNRAVGYIEENLAGDIRVDTAARHAGCSVWEFQRVFSFLTHQSLGDYIRGRRLALAAAELRGGGDKVIDIAIKYGYDSPAAFSRAFRQLYGMSPSSARGAGALPAPCPKITFETIEQGRRQDMEKRTDMETYGHRGYYVKENAPVYFTRDMDKTCQWFRDVLGWYGDIVARDDNGAGNYGCVFDYPGELIVAHLTPFRGIHLFQGEPQQGVVGFILVQGLDKLRRHVLDRGWRDVTEITEQPWGAKECDVNTVDGGIIRFFETTS